MLINNLANLAKTNPTAVAVVAGAERLTYAELDGRAGKVATLLTGMNVGRGALVAVYMERNANAIASLLGVMKSGAAYTVVEEDGNFEENCNRLAAMDAAAVVTTDARAADLRARGINAVAFSKAAHCDERTTFPELTASDTAYVLFTSGSTGRPKGVAISHGNIAHYVDSIRRRLGITRPLAYGHASTLSADLGNTCLFLSFWTGSSLHVIDGATRKDPRAMLDYLADNNIEFLKITPSHWSAIFQNAAVPHVTRRLRFEFLVLGGEKLSVRLAKEILQAGITRVLVNHYGPTETTVGVATYLMTDAEQLAALKTDSIPIGLPLGDTRLLVRTEAGDFVDRSAEGELFIGGPSVAIGYRGDPDTTAKSFITDVERGVRFYRTGDHVRIDSDGVVEFIGRVDRQVKVNGYRIELEHIEGVIRNIDGVDGAAAYLLDDQGKSAIAAAVLMKDATCTAAALKSRLGQVLPEYMVPRKIEIFADFPRNQNGKTDLKALRLLLDERLRVPAVADDERSSPPAGPLVEEVREIWRQCLRDARFGDDDDFFDVGGDSLDAIRVIAELQVRGYSVSAHVFLGEPTVNALAQALKKAEKPVPSESRQQEHTRFSSAQHWFFRKQFVQPDHYNQAILLECEQKVDLDILRAVVARLQELHPLLRTAFRSEDGHWIARPATAPLDAALSSSSLMREAGADDIAAHISSTAQALQASLRLEDGRVFVVHLFKFDDAPDQLLLLAHHLSVDVVSWHILVADIARLYGIFAAGEVDNTPRNPVTFWEWVEHIDSHRSMLRRDAAFWRTMLADRTAGSAPIPDARNIERTAQTVWLGFSWDETATLLGDLDAAAGVPVHAALLGAFVFALMSDREDDGIVVDVESHGRLTCDDAVDISRVVGWFTSMFPLKLAVKKRDLLGTVRLADAMLSRVPKLGVAYGLFEDEISAASGGAIVPQLCFNYLGEFRFGRDDRFAVSPSRYSIGLARGGANNRIHALKLTARIVNGHLVADLSFQPDKYDPRTMERVMTDTRRELLSLANVFSSDPAPLLLEQGASTGLIAHVPRALPLEQKTSKRIARKRMYRNVLLTGASGYVGIHVLHELLRTTDAHVYCLMRGKNGISPKQRLEAAYSWYFPHAPLRSHTHRYTVLEGDAALEAFGLPKETSEYLGDRLDAIYHFAANTRLFGSSRSFLQNVDGVRSAIELARARRPKDLHYMSTLAVCGVNPKSAPATFSESSLDIGQEFQNEYERTKFMAERLLLDFAADGGSAFIFRSGNVSAHSETGKFQMNASDNRFVQFLAAVMKLGKLPRDLGENIVLSPVDKVASGIVSISLNADVNGGTFHVDSPWDIEMVEIFANLISLGVSFEATNHETFADLFRAHHDLRDPEIALGYFWAMRKPRNVRFNHERTLELLDDPACRFDRPDQTWVLRFLQQLTHREHASDRSVGSVAEALAT
jgi:amino acid adenylation domain-containing protein/thioester reductase-like protein/non-ribosomal peptide synthase protein (TIGR01720 family)